MQILAFGRETNRKLLLIHGFQVPWQVWTPYIWRYQEDFHVLVPILPGHNPKGKKEDLRSFAEAARDLEEFLLPRWGDRVYAVFAMSMGGVLAATLWENGKLHIDKLIFDGSPLVSFPWLMTKFSLRFYLDVTHKTQKRDKKTVEQAGSLVPREYLPDFLAVLDSMSDETIINCVNGVGNYRLPNMISAPNPKIYYFHGTTASELFSRQTAKYLLRNYPHNTVVESFPKAGHCQISLMHPEEMLQALEDILA